ncbi:MAG: rhodanese-like domain-containing protein [Oligoflexus sp.]
MDSIKVINFYKFIPLAEPSAIALKLKQELAPIQVLGTIILAREGLNAGLAGLPQDVDQAFQVICSDPHFSDLNYRESFGSSQPYRKLLIRTKHQILTFPEPFDPSIDEIHEGPALSPDQWHHKLVNKTDDLVLIDTRNRYELEKGSFHDASDLEIDHFKDFPDRFLKKYGDQKDKTYFMFCTGGIRCEKAVAFARKQGFEKVYKLDGGIINYLRDKGQGQWQGECFVFDQRWSINADRLEIGENSSEANEP